MSAGFIEMMQTATLHEIEKQIILARIAASNADDNITTVARSLGIGKTTLYRKLKEYGK